MTVADDGGRRPVRLNEADELRADLQRLTIARENDLRRVQTLLHENRQLRARVNELERAGDNRQWRRDLPDADSP